MLQLSTYIGLLCYSGGEHLLIWLSKAYLLLHYDPTWHHIPISRNKSRHYLLRYLMVCFDFQFNALKFHYLESLDYGLLEVYDLPRGSFYQVKSEARYLEVKGY